MSRVYLGADEGLFERAERSRRSLEVALDRHRANPATTQRTLDIYRWWPGIDSAKAVALAESGHDAESPAVEQAAVETHRQRSGGLFGKIGQVVSPVVGAVTGPAGDIVSDVAAGARSKLGEMGHGVKMVARAGFTTLDSLYEELTGVIRAGGWAAVKAKEGAHNPLDYAANFGGNIPDAFSKSGASTGRIAIRDLIRGDEVDLGSGFFPGGSVAEEQRRQAEVLQIDGAPISTGRVAANRVFEQGTIPYNVTSGAIDGSILLVADPGELALRGASQGVKARRSFVPVVDKGQRARVAERLGEAAGLRREAGVIEGATRATVLPERAEGWLRSSHADRLAEWVADSDFDTVWNGLGRGRPLPLAFSTELADAQTATEAKDVLRRWIVQGGITEKPRINRLNLALKQNSTAKASRLVGSVPKRSINWRDPEDGLEQLDRFQRAARLPRETIAANNEAFARAAGSRQGTYDALTQTMDSVAEHLATEFGVKDRDALRRATRFFAEDVEDARLYGVTEIAEEMAVPGVTIGEDGRRLQSPFMFVHYLNDELPLPDARELRRLASEWKPILNNPAARGIQTATDAFMNEAWKPWTLLRPAWTLRVVGEEQFRIAGSGLDSMVNHPLSAIAWSVGTKEPSGRLARWAKKAAEKAGIDVGRGELDALGARFADELAGQDAGAFAQSMSRRALGMLDDDISGGFLRTKHKGLLRPTEEGYVRAWAEEIVEMGNDPIMRRIANDGVEATKAWFRDGEGVALRRQLMGEARNAQLGTVEGADGYIEFLGRYLSQVTSDHPELLEAVRSRKFMGGKVADGAGRVDKGFREALDGMVEDAGPRHVVGDLLARRSATAKALDHYDRATDFLFTALMERPTNFLSRSPTFRQMYWQKMRDVAPYLDVDDQARLLDAAREAKLGKDDLRALGKIISSEGGAPLDRLTLAQADTLAKAHGLEETKRLLYDLSERKQFWDITRNIFPFGEAWQEVLSRWAQIGTRHPQVVRRAQVAITSARQADPDGDGRGFFHTDPQTGEEVFIYPGSQMVTNALTGVPVPLKGRVDGLSMIGQIYPGVGPAVQIPAAYLVPDTPEFASINEVLFPFGEPDVGRAPLDAFMPAWMQRGMAALGVRSSEQERLWANTVMSVADYLASTGDYDLYGPDARAEQARMLDDAKDAARGVYVMRTFGQVVAPTSPSPRYLVEDPDGHLVMVQKVAEEWNKLLDEDPATATERFLQQYGPDLALVMQGKTRGVFPATAEIDAFAKTHPGLVEQYPETYGFFAPHGGDFDYASYLRQIRSGERKVLTPNEYVAQANHRVARVLLNEARKEAGDDEASRVYLRQYREALMRDYPGFDPYPTELGEVPRRITELAQIVERPEVASTDVGQAVILYLQARQQAQAVADVTKGVTSFTSAKSLAPVREWLRRIGAALVVETPGFAPVWEQLLVREIGEAEKEDGDGER